MKNFNNNQIYNASIIIDHILNSNNEELIKNGIFCNAIRLCLGKPYIHSKEYYAASVYDFLFDINAENDVY